METINNLIYFDYNRTTPIDLETLKTIELFKVEALTDRTLIESRKKEAIEKIAQWLNCKAEQILFTKSTSDGIRKGMQAAFETLSKKGNHIITNISEHSAMIDVCKKLEKEGAEISYLNITKEGLIDIEALKQTIRTNTILVSIMAANNETGVLQPIEEISELCKQHGITFFSDASQFVGKMRCDLDELGVNFMAFSSHKIYGPKDVGLLFVKQPTLFNTLYTNNNENNFEDIALIVGLGKMAEIAMNSHWENSSHISKLKNYFEHQLLDIEGLRINGSTRFRLYNTSNIQFPDDRVYELFNKFTFSHNKHKPSYVLQAMGLSELEIKNSFRFSFGKNNTLEEVKYLTNEILKLYQE